MSRKLFGKLTAFSLSVFIIICSLSVSFCVLADGEGTVSAGEILFTGSGGEEIYSFEPGGSVNVSCEITNDSIRKSINLYVGLYKKEENGDKLVTLDKQTLIFAANESYTLTDTFSVPANTDESFYIKAFVLNDALEPYTYPGVLNAAIDAETYFVNNPTRFKSFVPGVIRPDEGTIEFTVTPDRAASELGNAYDMIFSLSSAVNEGSAVNNILALCVPQISETRTGAVLQFVMKNRATASYLEYPLGNMGYTAGSTFNIALTWKTGGSMNMYAADANNVVQLGSTQLYASLSEDTFSYMFSVDKYSPFRISNLMISSKQLTKYQISKLGAFNSNSSDVTLYSTNNLTNTIIKKSSWNQTSLYNTVVPAFRSGKQVYTEGERAVYPVVGINHSGAEKTYTVNISMSDLDGTPAGTKTATIRVPADSKYHVTEIPLPETGDVGLYNLNTRITAPDSTYREFQSSISILPDTSDAADGAYSLYYGHHIGSSSDVSVFKKLNVTASRMWLNEFIWYNLEPTQGSWNWSRMDDYVASLEAEGIEMIGVLGYPSRWAAQEPTQEERDACLRYEYRPNRWKPRSYTEWENYVSAVVSRYAGRIKYWEVYNEVNFHPPYSPAAFSGSTAEYAELLQRAYSAAKAADPDCEILISGFSPPSGAVDSQMPLEFTNSQYNTGYYDIYNVHGYAGVNAVSSWLTAYRTARPGIKAFMTEEYPYQQGTDAARAHAAIALPLDFLKAGYDKYFHFSMFGQDGVFFTPDTNSPTLAYQAEGVLQANLRKCETYNGSYTGISGNPGILDINMRFTRQDGKTLSVFSASDMEFNLFVSGNILSCFDMYGREITPETQDGALKIHAKDVAYIVSNGALTVSQVRAADTGEIITNGGFEVLDGDVAAVGLANCNPSDWSIMKFNANGTVNNSAGGVRLSETTKNSGKYSLWFKNSTEGEKKYIYQNVSLPSAGTYKFTARIKKNTDSSDLKPFMFFQNGDTNQITESEFTIDYGSFTTVTATFTVNLDTDGIIGVGLKTGVGEIYVDDVSVEKISDVLGDIVVNGGFEYLQDDLPVSWELHKTDSSGNSIGAITKSSGSKHTGSYSMWIRGQSSGSVYLYQGCSFPSAGIYRMTVYLCKRQDPDNNLQPYMFFRDGYTGTYNNIMIQTADCTNANTFYEKTGQFTVTEESLHNSGIGIGVYSGSGQIYVDDIVIERIGDLPTEPTEILSNGGFEEYDENSPPMPLSWEVHTVNGNTTTGIVRRSGGGKHSGTYGLWMRYDNVSGSMYIYQPLNLTSAGTYRMRFYIRINKNYDIQPFVFFRDGNTGTDTNTIITNATSSYTLQTVDFTVGAGSLNNSGIGIGIYSSSAGSEIYIDDVVIEKID